MTDQTRAGRLGLEPGSIDLARGENVALSAMETRHSIAISLRGLRVAAERIADTLAREEQRHIQRDRP